RLSVRAYLGREQLREVRTERRVDPELEEPVDDAGRQQRPCRAAERRVEIERNRENEADAEQPEDHSSADAIAEIGVRDEAQEAAEAVEEHVDAGDGRGQAALGLQERREIVADRIARALSAERSEEHTSELQSRENLVC